MDFKKLDEIIEGIGPEVRDHREHLHEHPELSLQEHETTAYVTALLEKWGYETFRPPGLETGVVAMLEGTGGTETARVAALRADIDALPITEETGLPFASEVRGLLDGKDVGVMHACGHDGHTAILLGVAKALGEFRGEVPGTIKFVFQPGEEGGAGGKLMADGGVLKDPDVDAIFALHCRYGLPVGMIELSETPNASTDAFEIEVFGRGGHGAYPHTTVDPIPVAAQIINGLQAIVSRRIHPARPAVVTVGSLRAGDTYNVIPDRAHMKGTIRTLDPETRELAVSSLISFTEKAAAAGGARAEVRIVDGYPPVRCDRGLIELVRHVATLLFGADQVRDQPDQTMGGEDFSYYLEDEGGVPGIIFRLGVGCTENQHTSRFDFGSAALVPGMRIMATTALRFLEGGTDWRQGKS
ncbi:MAG: M20 metallopeptidase family protein [Planctomycetota bacterium]|jgi:amidohydrolase